MPRNQLGPYSRTMPRIPVVHPKPLAYLGDALWWVAPLLQGYLARKKPHNPTRGVPRNLPLPLPGAEQAPDVGSEEGSYSRLIDFRLTQLNSRLKSKSQTPNPQVLKAAEEQVEACLDPGP